MRDSLTSFTGLPLQVLRSCHGTRNQRWLPEKQSGLRCSNESKSQGRRTHHVSACHSGNRRFQLFNNTVSGRALAPFLWSPGWYRDDQCLTRAHCVQT